MFLNFSESEFFAGEALFLGNIFSYSLVFGMNVGSLLSFNPKNIYFYKGFLWEQTFTTG